MAKPQRKTFHLGVKVVMDVGLEVTADNMAEAVALGQAMKISDVIDFKTLGLEHNDSEPLHLTSVWEG